MTLKNSFKTALRGLRTNKSRAVLTILGIVIGVTAIILIMSLGSGAQDLILSQIQGLGSKTIVVMPGREPTGPSDVAQTYRDSLKARDITELQKKTNVPNLAQIMPIVFGGTTASYEGRTYQLSVFGASDLIGKIFDIVPSEGAFFTDEDIRSRSDAIIIGSKVKQELFGESDALGQRIKIGEKKFKVAGVLSKKGQVSFFNFDETAIVPYTTAQEYIFGIKYFHRIIIEADSEAKISQTVSDIESTLRNSHGIQDPKNDDFFVQTQADLAERVSIVVDIFTMFLLSVAAISLLVGGIGIMNIMLVSVTERTREIGLRKALGATEKDILAQFLLEAVILTASGGIIAIALGAILSFLAAIILTRVVMLEWNFVFPISAAIIGLGISSLIGLIFGIYPAKKASSKNPIEALRYE